MAWDTLPKALNCPIPEGATLLPGGPKRSKIDIDRTRGRITLSLENRRVAVKPTGSRERLADAERELIEGLDEYKRWSAAMQKARDHEIERSKLAGVLSECHDRQAAILAGTSNEDLTKILAKSDQAQEKYTYADRAAQQFRQLTTNLERRLDIAQRAAVGKLRGAAFAATLDKLEDKLSEGIKLLADAGILDALLSLDADADYFRSVPSNLPTILALWKEEPEEATEPVPA